MNNIKEKAQALMDAMRDEYPQILDSAIERFNGLIAAKDSAILEARILELEQALNDCLVYCPEYMHGIPKKEYEILLNCQLSIIRRKSNAN